MLISDDERRWVTANGPACELLAIDRAAVPWHPMDDFTPLADRGRLRVQWKLFLARGHAEGWIELYVPDRGPVAVEFSAIANVMPGRHLSVLLPTENHSATRAQRSSARRATSEANDVQGREPFRLTKREREVMTLVAAGGQSGDIAKRLFLASETVDAHVNNARRKLGAHTRAHAVGIALVTGQITWPED